MLVCVCTQDEQKREKNIQIVKQGTLLGAHVFQQSKTEDMVQF